MRYYYQLVLLGIRIIRNEGYRSFCTRFKGWLLQNTRRRFKLLWMWRAGLFNRAANTMLPYYQRFVPMRIKAMVPDRLREAVKQQLRVDDKALWPNRTIRLRGDGVTVLSVARDRDHCWYSNDSLKKFLKTLRPELALPRNIRRLLVIGHDFALTTGVSRPVYHYLNALAVAGGTELVSIELIPGASVKNIFNEFDSADFVIVNSISAFVNHDDMVDLMRRGGGQKTAIYLHETEWVFQKFEKQQPERFRRFVDTAEEFNFLCSSEKQKRWLRDRFGVSRAKVVYNTTNLFKPVSPNSARILIKLEEPLRVVMIGTIQHRKGVTLFSQVADLAAELGLPWKFCWAGREVKDSKGIYKSPNVEFVGNLYGEDYHYFLTQSDVFLLSSFDDPFPLSCLEALQAYKRVVVYRNTGIVEILDGVKGTAIYEEYSPEAAFVALRGVVNEQLDVKKYKSININISSLSSFVRRMNRAIEEFHGSVPSSSKPELEVKKTAGASRIAVVLHLFYHDLWYEIRGYLFNFRDWSFDLYVTLTDDKTQAELKAMETIILRDFPEAHVFVCPNRGMDIGPFFTVLNFILDKNLPYDLVLKIHSKKSEIMSGTEEGAQWRTRLLDGLIGSPTRVAQILGIFNQYPHVGMIAPKGFLMDLSSRDRAAGCNLNAKYMDYFFSQLDLKERSLQFFRGSMFWVRAEIIFNAFRNCRIYQSEFEPGFLSDGSKAHAMERVFANIVRDQGKVLYEFDEAMPKHISLLSNKYLGNDIYVIGAGPTCDFIDPSFFENKIVIGVNRVYKRFPCDYVVFKEHPGFEAEKILFDQKTIPIVSKWDSGNISKGKRRLNTTVFTHPNCHFFDHLENQHTKVDLSVIGTTDKIVVSYSTMTSAIHVAAYMGAKNILLVGHDCGVLDGKAVFSGYYTDIRKESPWKNWDEYKRWLGGVESQTRVVKQRLCEIYNCNIHSINPFISLGLEGHKFTSTKF